MWLNQFANRYGPILIILFMLQFVSMGSMEMSGPFWPVYLQTLSSDTTFFSIAGIGVYVGPLIGISLTSAFWGRIGDRYGNRLMIIRALLGLSVTQLLIAFTNDLWIIMALRFLQGAFAGYIAPAQAYGVQIASPEQRTKLFAFLQIATNVGSLAGALLGGLILDVFSFPIINITAGAICGLCALAAWFILPMLPHHKPDIIDNTDTDTAALLPPVASMSVSVAGLLLLTAILLTSRMVLQVPFSLYMQTMFATYYWVTGLCYGLMALGFVLAAPLWAWYFSDKAPSDVLRGVLFICIGCFFTTLFAGMTGSVVVFAALYFAWGAFLGGTTPVLLTLVSAATRLTQQGAALGFAQTCQQLASILGIVLGVWISQSYGLGYVFPLVALLYVLSFFIALTLWVQTGRVVSMS